MESFSKMETIVFWIILNAAAVFILVFSGRNKKEKQRNKKALAWWFVLQVLAAGALVSWNLLKR
jgi:hypothetical protein